MATSDLKLVEGEEVKAVARAELYATSDNPLLNLWLRFVAFLLLLIGKRNMAQITVTNKRLVCESKSRILWVFPTAAVFRTVLPQAVASVQYSYQALCCCCCRQCTVAVTQIDGTTFGFIVKGSTGAATELANLVVQTLAR